MDTEKTCCFTGHRPVKLPWAANEADPRCENLKQQIASALLEIYRAGYRHFICGMAIGCDTYFAQEVLKLRERYLDITLEAAIPCDSQADKWNHRQKECYASLLAACDHLTYVSHSYTPDCMMKRNEYMIDHSSLLLACFNGKSSGTMKTILYAQRKGIRTIILDI